MKKQDEKRQGTTRNVSSRNCVKERNAKQTQQETREEIRQKHAAQRNRNNLLQQKRHGNKRRQKQKIVKQAHKSRSITNLYLANTREVGSRSRGFKGYGLVVGGKRDLYLVSSRNFFWEYTLLGWYLIQKK